MAKWHDFPTPRRISPLHHVFASWERFPLGDQADVLEQDNAAQRQTIIPCPR